MAYAARFRFRWRSKNDNIYLIEILQNGYNGSVVQRPLGGAPQLRRDKNGAVCGTSLEFLAQAQEDGEFAVLFTSNPQAFRVDLYQNGTLIWQGFVTPELYSEPYIAPPYNVKVTATDNLGELKLSDYTAQGRVSIATLLSYFLGKTGLSLPVHWLNAMHPSSAASVTAADMAASTTVNLDHMEGDTCYDVLAKVLDTFHAIIVQHNCQWLVVRETDLEYLRNGNTITAPDGSTFAIGDFGSMASKVWWPVGYLSQTVKPAKKEKVIKAPNNWLENLLPKTATSVQNATYEDAQDGTTPYYELVPYSGTTVRTSSVALWSSFSEFVPTHDLTLSLTLQTFGVISGHTYGKKCAEVRVYVIGSDGSSYINRYVTATGEYSSSVAAALSIDGTYRETPETFHINVPIKSLMASAGYNRIYQIQVTLVTVSSEDSISRIRLFEWGLNLPELNKGYQVTCILANGARGADSPVEIAVADNTEKALEAVFVTNGMKYDIALGGASIAQWASGNVPSLPLLEFLARDYCLSIATPRLYMEGVINVPEGEVLPLLFRGGGLIYWPETWNWNLLEDRLLDIKMLSLPAAAVQVTSVTRQAQGSDGMIIGGESTPSAGGGGGQGTVTSVSVSMPPQFVVTGSPITSEGTIEISLKSGYTIITTEAERKFYAAYESAHTHSNKTTLDNITSTKVSNWDDAATAKHSHSNKSILDGIDDNDIDKWDEAYDKAHTHGNKSTLDNITSTKVSNWDDAATAKHTHSNKSFLDGIDTADQTFDGNKTFSKNVTVSQKMSAAALVIPGSAPSGSYVSTSEWYISIDTSAISGSVV